MYSVLYTSLLRFHQSSGPYIGTTCTTPYTEASHEVEVRNDRTIGIVVQYLALEGDPTLLARVLCAVQLLDAVVLLLCLLLLGLAHFGHLLALALLRGQREAWTALILYSNIYNLTKGTN